MRGASCAPLVARLARFDRACVHIHARLMREWASGVVVALGDGEGCSFCVSNGLNFKCALLWRNFRTRLHRAEKGASHYSLRLLGTVFPIRPADTHIRTYIPRQGHEQPRYAAIEVPWEIMDTRNMNHLSLLSLCSNLG
eukprot:IDg14740t1